MLRFIASRLVQFPLILAVIYLTTFALAWVAPGDPFSSEKSTPEQVAALKARYNIESSWSFLTTYPVEFFKGNLGPSFKYQGTQVEDIIADALPVSLSVGALAIVIATLVGVGIGTVAAVARGGVLDFLSLTIALVGVSLPSFVIAAGLLAAFSYKIGVGLFAVSVVAVAAVVLVIFWLTGRLESRATRAGFLTAAGLLALLPIGVAAYAFLIADLGPRAGLPLGGWPSDGFDDPDAYAAGYLGAALDYLRHMLLPAAALSLLPMAYITRLARVSMIDVLSSDYVRTARAKGVSRPLVVFKHCLRNALLPVLSFLGPATANVLVGSFVVETIFDLPGLGPHFVESVQFRDQPLILGTVMLYSTLLLTLNLVVDVLYSVVDPRISLDAGAA